MPEENPPSLQVDTDWKKQAQDEKRRLAEQEQQARAAAATAPRPAVAPSESPAADRAPRERAPATFASLVSSLLTQVLLYLGDVAIRGQEPVINLDMAKHLIDTLGVLDEKTKGNLSDEERTILDRALYESRMRYVAVAAQFVNP